MKFLFIYVDDIRDAVRCQLEKVMPDLSDRQVEETMDRVKRIHGPRNPIGGNPRLGILTLASILRKTFPGIDIQYCDMAFECLEAEDLRAKIKKAKPDFIGLSSMLPFAHVFHQVTKIAKEEAPQATVLGGGPYLSSSPRRALEDPCLDVGVLFEAEETLPELMRVLLEKGDLSQVQGIGYRGEDGEVRLTSTRPMVKDLNQVPWPAIDLINLDHYKRAYRIITPPLKSMPIFSSRGCSYECTYCHNLSGKTVRWRSAENVFEEMSYYYREHEVREFFFWDDIFNLNIKRAHQLCDLILKSGMKIRFSFPRGMRGDILTHELIDKMVDAGLCQSSFAVESASPRIQKMIKKYNNFNKLSDTIAYCVERGVLVTTFNMVDFPEETEEEMAMTLDYNLGLRHHDVTLFKLSPFEGTPIYDQVGGYDHHENLGAATFYKYTKRMISSVGPEFLQGFVKEFGLRFYFSKERMKRALEFSSPHIPSEDLREHFQNMYSVAKMHYGIEEKDLADAEAVRLMNVLLNPGKVALAS
ncbi:MAG TPA: radical SAM protein [bacterium]|nr:radical SAM protein [bacterium]